MIPLVLSSSFVEVSILIGAACPSIMLSELSLEAATELGHTVHEVREVNEILPLFSIVVSQNSVVDKLPSKCIRHYDYNAPVRYIVQRLGRVGL
jgi:hypothetical protein